MAKKILLLTVALLLGVCLAPAKGNSGDELNYEIEGAGTGAQGSYLVKVWGLTSKNNPGDDYLCKCAVHGVLFRGFSNKELRQSQRPLAGSALVEQQHADFFKDFFSDGGSYKNYATMVSANREVVKIAKKKYKVGAVVTVNKEQLLKDLQAAGVVRGLTTEF